MIYEMESHPTSDCSTQNENADAGDIAGPSDEELMERIQEHDERALELLMKRYDAMLRSVVGRMLSVDQDVTGRG